MIGLLIIVHRYMKIWVNFSGLCEHISVLFKTITDILDSLHEDLHAFLHAY